MEGIATVKISYALKGLTILSSFRWILSIGIVGILPSQKQCLHRRISFEDPDETFGTERSYPMSWDKIEGQWKQRRGKAMHHWGKLMNDDLAAIAGKYEELVGKLQEKYGIAKGEIDEFKKTSGLLKKANTRLIQLQKTLRGKGIRSKKSISIRKPTKTRARAKSKS